MVEYMVYNNIIFVKQVLKTILKVDADRIHITLQGISY